MDMHNCRILLWMAVVWRCVGVGTSLLFPAASVLQITASFSAPIENPVRRIFWDWGLQMNYDLPFNLDKFINEPIWPNKFDFDDRKRRDLDYQQLQQPHGNHSLWHIADKYRQPDALAANRHPSDFSAGELYYALENLLTSYGFHETCLLRSVCELARHPFSDDHQNLITEVLTFILTPSLHEAFSESELLYRDAYEEAERRGFLHCNCADPVCIVTPAVTDVLLRAIAHNFSFRCFCKRNKKAKQHILTAVIDLTKTILIDK